MFLWISWDLLTDLLLLVPGQLLGLLCLTVVAPHQAGPGSEDLLSEHGVQGVVPLGLSSGEVVVEPGREGLVVTREREDRLRMRELAVISGISPGSPALRQLCQESFSRYVEQVLLCVDINTKSHCVLHQFWR